MLVDNTKETIVLPKTLEEFLRLKELGVMIHNYNECLLFLKEDIQHTLSNTKVTQKILAQQLGMNEPSFSLMMKFFKSLDILGYKTDINELIVSYDNTTYILVKGK